MTKDEILGKVESEGGIAEAIIGYGVNIGDLPDDVPEVVKTAWLNMYNARADYQVITEWLYWNEGGVNVSANPVRPDEPALSSGR